MKYTREELDELWAGMWFCHTCQFHTGQLNLHPGHIVSYMPKCRHEQRKTFQVGFPQDLTSK